MEKHKGFGLAWACGHGQHALDEHDRDILPYLMEFTNPLYRSSYLPNPVGQYCLYFFDVFCFQIDAPYGGCISLIVIWIGVIGLQVTHVNHWVDFHPCG